MKFDITLKQYELIYGIVASVGHHFSHGSGRSCQFYNVNGAIILNQILKIEAKPVMGAAFILLNDKQDADALCFAGEENGDFYSSPDAFHCWIETKNNIIDFTAPEYREAAHGISNNCNIPRNMFQKPKLAMSKDPYSLEIAGDFFFSANKELTNHLLGKMMSIPASQDLANICLHWCKKHQKNKVTSMSIMNDLGELTNVTLKKGNLQGAW